MKGVELRGFTVGYGASLAIRRVGFSALPGQVTGIVGPNGAGKSTVLKAALGLLPVQSGTASLDGKPLIDQRRRVAYVPQRSVIDWDFPAVVAEIVGMGRHPHQRWFGWRRDRRHDQTVVAEALERVGLTEMAGRQIGSLSGGQQQRVFLARALAQEADTLFLDEPFAGVDALTEMLIWTELERLRQEGRVIVVVNHDLASVTIRFDKLVLLAGRVIAEGPTAEVFTERNIAATYGSVPTVVERPPVNGAAWAG